MSPMHMRDAAEFKKVATGREYFRGRTTLLLLNANILKKTVTPFY